MLILLTVEDSIGLVHPVYLCNLTCWELTNLPWGKVLPFALATCLKVAMALPLFPANVSKRGLSGSHFVQQKKVQARVYCQLYSVVCIYNDILTKQKQINSAIGKVERPSSHLQPRVGITHIASRTSKTAPTDQNAWCTQIHQSTGSQKAKWLIRWNEKWKMHHSTAVNMTEVPLDFTGRNSEYSVTLKRSKDVCCKHLRVIQMHSAQFDQQTYDWGAPPRPTPTRDRRKMSQPYTGANALNRPKYDIQHMQSNRHCAAQSQRYKKHVKHQK